MDKQFYLLYELLLVLKAEVFAQSKHHDPVTLAEEYHLDIRIDKDDPPLLLGSDFNPGKKSFMPKRNFLIKLHE